jgi:GTP-binding protein
VDLPGYGFARTSKENRENSLKLITDYIINRKNLICLFILLDCRHEPQSIDMEIMEWAAFSKIPFVICFTKTDKLSVQKLTKNIDNYKKMLLKRWESLPDIFITSSAKKTGRDEILSFIIETNKVVNI